MYRLLGLWYGTVVYIIQLVSRMPKDIREPFPNYINIIILMENKHSNNPCDYKFEI